MKRIQNGNFPAALVSLRSLQLNGRTAGELSGFDRLDFALKTPAGGTQRRAATALPQSSIYDAGGINPP